VVFDHGKTEAAIFCRKTRKGTQTEAKVKVGDKEVSFNRAATRWLGVWLDSQLTLKEHHATRLKSGRNAMNRLKRLTGQMGLSPVNCRRIMTACVQSVAMFGAELWWKGGNIRGTTGRAEELQLLVNREARATTGAFRTTNLGALAMESGIRPASNQLENRQCRFGLRLLSLPQGDKARDIISAQTAIGQRLKTALNHTWIETEQTVLLEDPESFDAELIQEERVEAKKEAERERPGLVMFTDGSRLENEAVGYAVAWKNCQTWDGIKTHMGFNQEAFDAECAALARALEHASRRNPTPERITIFTDARAAIRRMASDEPGPGQKYAIEARRHIAALRRGAPDVTIEIRWCPAHEGIDGNETADTWAKLAADEPDAHGVEGWTRADRPEEQPIPLPRSLANIKREIAEKKWAEARQWVAGRTSRKKYKMSNSQRPDDTVAGSTKRLAARFYQLKTGHALTGVYLHWTKARPTPQCWWCPYPRQTREHLLKGCPKWRKQQKVLWKEVWKETGGGRFRWKAHELFAEPRASQAVLNFLSSTDVGKTVLAVEEEADAGSEVSEWELRKRQEREDERGAEAEALGVGEEPLFLPTPPFMASVEAE
jgi:ribonuclease HI